jgi:hypothetical protein
MSAVPLLKTQPTVRPERRYWLDEGSLQRLLDLMFCYIAGERAFGSEEHLGWVISWDTRYDGELYARGADSPDEYLERPVGYSARISAPGLVTDTSVDRILSYLDGQGLSAVAYEQDSTTFEFAIG